MEPDLTVVVMAYNELPSLEPVVAELESELASSGRSYELLIVDDGSTDGTAGLCERLARQDPRRRLVRHWPNQGLGGVYRTGFSQARGALVTFYPGDGQFPAEILGSYLPLMREHDLVLGFIPRREDSVVSRLLSFAERALYRLLFGRFPRFQGILMFRRGLLGRFTLKSSGRGWAVLMEFILRAQRGGARIASVAIPMRPRAHGVSRVNNWRTIWANLREVLALRWKL